MMDREELIKQLLETGLFIACENGKFAGTNIGEKAAEMLKAAGETISTLTKQAMAQQIELNEDGERIAELGKELAEIKEARGY